MSRRAVHSIAIELTSHCNQRCSYCYNDWRADNGRSVGALPHAELLAVVQRALTELSLDHVTLTGGETFARADVFDVLDLCRAHGVDVQIISNGGLVSDALAERLAAYPIRCVQITLNGPTAALHEEHVGGEHFEATLEGIRALRRHGVPVAGCIVITRRNAAVVGEILDLFVELGVRLVALSRFSPAGYAAAHVAELLPSRRDMIAALDQVEPRGAELGLDLQVTMPVPPCVIDHADYPHVRFGGCPIGTDAQELALGPRGELRACTLHTQSLGDARHQPFAELLDSPVLSAYRDVTPEFCAPCPHRRSCLGGCGAAAASVLGDPRGLDPFVAQHVDDAFAERLRRTRRGSASLPVLT
ncbi:MAG: radical SAM protein [Myxococcales bacterium]|nr:radical SAM protein [Myxococcales bacterium]MCB9713440.1 radical SAM protein [Myxococcales bacterium]